LSSHSDSSSPLTPELLSRLTERIEASLEKEPLLLEPAEHRRQIADLLARVGEMTHYEVLSVGLSAGEREIYDGYVERARLVHPSHVPRLSLEGLAVGPELLFERATLAYLTLSDEERRLSYNIEIGLASSRSMPVPMGQERAKEEREMARRNYELARRQADEEEFFYAIELLYVATRLDPQAEYLALLGRCQSENPKWLRKAIQSYSRALELSPGEAEWRLEVASLYERDGNLPMARREYAALLERVPGHPDALDALKRLKS
jgi:tetratricopeptide (TPR) repeat protein